MSKIGVNISQRRKRLNMTQEELSISLQTMYHD